MTDNKEPRVVVETYSEELYGVSGNPSMVLVHKFGERQNAYNRNMETRMQAVQSVCRRFQGEINRLQEENEKLRAELSIETNRNHDLFDRMAAEIKKMQNEINKLRLSSKLNTNAVDKLMAEYEKLETQVNEKTVKNS
ncbi:MAG: hypothetical protein ACI4JN_05745 [Ruminococcus sp.]